MLSQSIFFAVVASMVAVSTALPTITCFAELESKCAMDKQDFKKCHECVDYYGKLANCTTSEEETYCRVQPPPGGECEKFLDYECGHERNNKTFCLRCVDANSAGARRANCTSAEVEKFCEPAPVPPGEECYHEMEAVCGNDRHNKTLCRKCITAHNETLKRANCSTEEEGRFCEAPKPPNASCYETLHKDCEKVANNKTACVTCAREHEQTDHCSSEEVEKFCHVTRNPGPQSCYRGLYEHCEADKANMRC